MSQYLASTRVSPVVRSGRQSLAWLASAVIAIFTLPACTSVNTFPTIARPGDTVSVMVGGSERARKETIGVTLRDVNGQTWNLKTLGLVRSVFNLRTDGRAQGLHYSSTLEGDISWILGHEPVQTVLIADIPANAAPGAASMTISLNASDNSSGVSDPFTVNLQIVPGSGSQDQFFRQDSLSGTSMPVNFGKLEPAPHAKISFGGSTAIGAASLKIGFNGAVLNGNDINLYTPESAVKSGGAFGDTQRMVYWRHDGQYLYVDVVAPQGIAGKYLQFFVIHPKGLSGSPNFVLTSVAVYGVDGAPISVQPTLEYFP
ncbi:hypothetical protein [Sulfuricaulis limicola]|nr:hypothetical protein [Sulfuricaulis limicola]